MHIIWKYMQIYEYIKGDPPEEGSSRVYCTKRGLSLPS